MKRKKHMTQLQKLQEESQSAVEIISTTIFRLKAANEKIDAEVAANEQKIQRIEENTAGLNSLKSSNAKVIAKFEAFFE